MWLEPPEASHLGFLRTRPKKLGDVLNPFIGAISSLRVAIATTLIILKSMACDPRPRGLAGIKGMDSPPTMFMMGELLA